MVAQEVNWYSNIDGGGSHLLKGAYLLKITA